MNSRDRPNTSRPANKGAKRATEHGATRIGARVTGSASTCTTSPLSSSRPSNNANSKHAAKVAAGNRRDKVSSTTRHDRDKTHSSSNKKINIFKDVGKDGGDLSSSSQEMATTSLRDKASPVDASDDTLIEQETTLNCKNDLQETDDDESNFLLESRNNSSSSDNGPNLNSCSSVVPSPKKAILEQTSELPNGWEQHKDKVGLYFMHVATGVIQRQPPSLGTQEGASILYHDDEEINQGSTIQRTSSEDDDLLESGAALTLAEDSIAVNERSESMNFVVYPIGCCEFDETELVSANNTRAIQKCILRLSNNPSREETMCWGLDQSQPILMRLQENYIQFLDVKSQFIYKSQPINTIKVWAVDDDNNFAFVIEERSNQHDNQPNDDNYYDSVEYELLAGPNFVCYVFSSMDDDDMSCRVAAKLNDEINKYREQMANRISQSTKFQQANDPSNGLVAGETADLDFDLDRDSDENIDADETTLEVKYIGMVQVPRPVGIDVLNVAIDKSLAEASKTQTNRLMLAASSSKQVDSSSTSDDGSNSALTEAKLHVSQSSVIVENSATGEIIVECRIRYLTFMGISRRDIRWCGFIMQNTTKKSFEAHCFECYPTAGYVCDAIQASCTRMYERMVKSRDHQVEDATSIISTSSKIRDTLAKTLSRIKLAPIIQ